ncbi:MAG TPA: HAD-IIB family hydrolase, partial [Saprospiraceae bacterium]|nr:HAD-IIB family hydrolase [Saprospiraceae bacterium]
EKFLSVPHKPCILALSRPDLRKNLHTLIDVYGQDKELQSMANLVIFAGIRKDIEKMPESEREVLVQILLLMDKYDLYGKLAIPKKHDVENEVATIYRYCAEKRGVFASLALHETFGLTIIEAASSGLPVVSTNNGGPAEIIPQCENGLLVDPLNPVEIASAIKRIISDDILWRAYSNAGVLNTQKYFSWQHHVDQYMQWVEKSFASSKSPRAEVVSDRMKLAEYLFATDIDGTLISEEYEHPGLNALISFLNDRPQNLALAYASGRSVKLVRNVIQEMQLPQPEFLVCSVGSQIYYRQGNDYVLDKGWRTHLDKNWNRDEVSKRMESLDWLELQEAEGQNPHKISYYLKDKQFKESQLKAVLGKLLPQLSIIVSHDLYLDLLPRQASKGKALRYLCKKWSIPYSHLITAGDSGNDLDMLTGSGKGIIVGNHAAELIAIKGNKNLYRATGYAAEGILEGLEHYGILPEDALQNVS